MSHQLNRKQRRQTARIAPAHGPGASSRATAAGLFAKAFHHFQADRLSEAMDLYRQVLVIDPKHCDSLHHLGLIAFKLGHHETAADLIGRAIALNGANADFHYNMSVVLTALGRFADVVRHAECAIALKRDHAGAHMLLGDACLKLRKLDEAIAAYRQGLAFDPADAEAHNNLAEALLTQGRPDEAAPLFEQALRLKPTIAAAYQNLALIRFLKQDKLAALNLIVPGLRIKETPFLKALFLHCLRFGSTIPDSSPLRHYCVRALSEPWGLPGNITYACVTLVKRDPRISDCIDRAVAAWPARLSCQALFGPDGLHALGTDPLLRAVLHNSQAVNDIPLERLLTLARAALLDAVVAMPAAADDAMLTLACLLARHCFSNEYVLACTADEQAQMAVLRAQVAAALRSGEPVAALPLALLASYQPLYSIPGSEALLAQSWSGEITDLLTQQVGEPLSQRDLRKSIPRLTPIDDAVSLLVQSQYEESPYPRWVKCAPNDATASIDERLRRDFPHARYRPFGPRDHLDVLIAGCGTGQQVIQTAGLYAGTRVLAVDLSLASLCYAKYRSDALGLANIEYGQADILKLAALDRAFDVITCSGVLHHLADPLAGWRVLLSILRPGGIIHIGLYSRIARTGISAARDFIAARGYDATVDDIRRCRQDILALGEESPVRSVVWSADFYALSNCRDLLFHVQEHLFTLLQIKAFLAENALTLLGFQLAPDVLQQYREQFPDDPACTDLDHWHAFEQQHPHTFGRMYQFVVQKSL